MHVEPPQKIRRCMHKMAKTPPTEKTGRTLSGFIPAAGLDTVSSL